MFDTFITKTRVANQIVQQFLFIQKSSLKQKCSEEVSMPRKLIEVK